MPSTFTSNTGIELLADGEQAGAWGQTTNGNFDIVDRALNGSVSIALSGTTHTLTTSNGVLSDGQAAVLVFTGSPSGTNTVTIAPNTAQKTYFVTNSTAQTVVLSQGSGANVSVPAGLSKIVFTNGDGATAAVSDITNTLSGNLTGNVTGNADTATALQNERTIGGVSFNGTTNINLPGVNIGGNQNTTGNAATATAWQTARTLTINGVGKSVDGTANVAFTGPEVGSVPSGGIIMWSGSIASVPTGWFLCDGANGTPDLRDRFVIGAGSTHAPNATGGAATVTLTTAQLPAHSHFLNLNTNASGDHRHNILNQDNQGNFGAFVNNFLAQRNSFGGSENYRLNGTNTEPTNGLTSVAGDHAHNVQGNTNDTGSNQAHENRPPFLALAYIMKA